MVLLVLADATGAGVVLTKKDVILSDIRKELNVTAGHVRAAYSGLGLGFGIGIGLGIGFG